MKLECQHFVESILNETLPLTNGRLGLEVVKILEAADQSLRLQGRPVTLGAAVPWTNPVTNGHGNAKENGNGNGKADHNDQAEGNGHGGLVVPAGERGNIAA